MADLPDLKKKQRERKKAGFFWGDGAAGSASFEGATGGLGAAGAGAAGVLEGAEGAAGRSFLARLAATLAGKLLLLGAAALLAAGVLAALAYRLQRAAAAVAPSPELSAPADTTRVRGPGGRRSLDFFGGGEESEPADDGAAAKGTSGGRPDAAGGSESGSGAGAEAGAPGAGAGAGADWAQVLKDGSWRKDRLAHDMKGARLTDSLGGGFSKNVFAGGQAPKFGDGFDRSGLAKAVPPAAQGRSSAMRSAKPTLGKAPSKISRISSRRAIAQLRAAQTFSGKAAMAGDEESARSMGADAFDGHYTQGAVAPASPVEMDHPAAANPPGGSFNAPGDNGSPTANPSPQQDYQPKVDAANNLVSQAAGMKKRSMMLMIIGLGLIAAGTAMLFNPFTAAAGMAMIAAGALMVGMAIMLAMMAGKLAAEAKQLGQQLQQVYGQKAQNQVIDQCANEAASSGQKCSQQETDAKAPNLPKDNQAGAAGRAASTENYGKDSRYTVDGQGGGH